MVNDLMVRIKPMLQYDGDNFITKIKNEPRVDIDKEYSNTSADSKYSHMVQTRSHAISSPTGSRPPFGNQNIREPARDSTGYLSVECFLSPLRPHYSCSLTGPNVSGGRGVMKCMC